MNPDELTPDELYRPASSEVLPASPGSYAPVPVQHHMPAVPDAYPPVQQSEQGEPLPPSGPMPSGEHVLPQQGQPWGPGPQQQYPGAADATQLIPPAVGPEPLDATQPIPRQAHLQAPQPPVRQPQPPVQPQVQVPPPPAEPPSVRPQQPPRRQQGAPAAPAASPSPSSSASPFTIRPGLPAGAYGERPSYAPAEEGSEETQLLPPLAEEPPGYGPGPAQPQATQPHPQQAFPAPPGPPQGPPPAQPYPAQPQSAPSQSAPPQSAQPHSAPPQSTQPFPAQPDLGQPYPPQPPGPRSRRAAPATGRRLSPAALAGIVVGGCAVAGLIAGAALSSGGDEDGQDTVAQKSAAASSTPSSAPVDPAKAQATELDSLLKDSNSSRSSVINAVEEIKSCKNLGGAAQDLRDAAAQRNDLVSRLAGIEVDKVPDHARLTAALNKAWASSASADNHYAAWADELGSRGCKKNRAKPSGHTAAGNRASGEATQAKQRAARLWNAVARQYGLTQRAAHQL